MHVAGDYMLLLELLVEQLFLLFVCLLIFFGILCLPCCCFCCCCTTTFNLACHISQDVLGILVEMGAMEESSLRLLPLGLVARSINCNNELWMAAAISSPQVMDLTPPQLAALVGALQCTDLLKRPMSIWSSYQVGDLNDRSKAEVN
jgi:hypothetical protein